MNAYTIRHGSIAALQYVKFQDVEIRVTYSTDDREIFRLPLPVQAAVNRQFGIIFSLPYERRQAFIDNSIPFIVEVEQ